MGRSLRYLSISWLYWLVALLISCSAEIQFVADTSEEKRLAEENSISDTGNIPTENKSIEELDQNSSDAIGEDPNEFAAQPTMVSGAFLTHTCVHELKNEVEKYLEFRCRLQTKSTTNRDEIPRKLNQQNDLGIVFSWKFLGNYHIQKNIEITPLEDNSFWNIIGRARDVSVFEELTRFLYIEMDHQGNKINAKANWVSSSILGEKNIAQITIDDLVVIEPINDENQLQPDPVDNEPASTDDSQIGPEQNPTTESAANTGDPVIDDTTSTVIVDGIKDVVDPNNDNQDPQKPGQQIDGNGNNPVVDPPSITPDSIVDALVGEYENHLYDGTDLKNNWHYVKLTKIEDKKLLWTNKADVTWELTFTGDKDALQVGQNPYTDNGFKESKILWGGGQIKGITGPFNEFYEFKGH